MSVVGQRKCVACLRSMVQCLMFIFRSITIPESIVVLHMYNILEIQVAVLMAVLLSCHFGTEIEFLKCNCNFIVYFCSFG